MSKFCGHCGSTLAENATFCPNCGAPATEQAAPQQQFSQPAFQQPGIGSMPVAKKGLSKGAKLGIIIGCGVVAVGLIIWLIIALVGGGYEKPIKNYIKGLENQDVSTFTDALTNGTGSTSILGGMSESSAASTYTSRLQSMISKYGEDFKINYKILEKINLGKSGTLGLYDDAYTLRIEFTVTGSKRENVVTKTVNVYKANGKWFMGSSISL